MRSKDMIYENDNYEYHFGPEYPVPSPEEQKVLDEKARKLKQLIFEKLRKTNLA